MENGEIGTYYQNASHTGSFERADLSKVSCHISTCVCYFQWYVAVYACVISYTSEGERIFQAHCIT